MSFCSGWCLCGHMWPCPQVGGGLLNRFHPLSASERTWQCSIPVMQNENCFDSRGILLINWRFGIPPGGLIGNPLKHSAVWDVDVCITWRRCLLLRLRTQFWLSTKIPYVGIYATILYVKPEKYFILLFKFPHRCGNLLLLLFAYFKHTSLNPMVEKCIDLSPV